MTVRAFVANAMETIPFRGLHKEIGAEHDGHQQYASFVGAEADSVETVIQPTACLGARHELQSCVFSSARSRERLIADVCQC